MGGLGSGAERSTHIGNVEDTVAIDIRVLRRLGVIVPGECVIDTICWSNGGYDAPSARLRTDLSDAERGGTMQIEFTSSGTAIKQRIAIDAVPSGFGGWRYYLICPITGQRCEIIYLSNGRFGSRQCQMLSYSSQNMDQLDRARRKAVKLRRRLDGKGHYPRPRGANRFEMAEKLTETTRYATLLYRRRLQGMINPAGDR